MVEVFKDEKMNWYKCPCLLLLLLLLLLEEEDIKYTFFDTFGCFGCLSYIDCVCLLLAIYNPSLQLQRLGPLVVVL